MFYCSAMQFVLFRLLLKQYSGIKSRSFILFAFRRWRFERMAVKKKTSKKKTTKKKTSAKKTAAKKKAAVKKKTAPKNKTTSKKKAVAKKKPISRKKTVAKKKPSAKKTAVKKKTVTKKKPAVKKSAHKKRKSTNKEQNFTPYAIRKDEDYMNAEQIEHFRGLLKSWKQELMQEVDRTVHHMQDEAANFPDPNDRASQESEFTMELRTRDRERKLIKKIDESLAMLDTSDYGYCEECGVEIGIRRLEARPTASLCIDCKSLDEIREKQRN